ncbi:LysR substrate-binding domain-containing protein [Rhizobium sp. SL86]|uniref:LysR substrate-binding domain-containing protein n=1 Tax=Rhizobium sp. SL86 TaxID=2995148 RepID=UPI003FA36A88
MYQGLRFDQFSMLIAVASAGLGFAILPTYLIESELQSGALRPLADLPMQTENAYFIVRPENKRTQVVGFRAEMKARCLASRISSLSFCFRCIFSTHARKPSHSWIPRLSIRRKRERCR